MMNHAKTQRRSRFELEEIVKEFEEKHWPRFIQFSESGNFIYPGDTYSSYMLQHRPETIEQLQHMNILANMVCDKRFDENDLDPTLLTTALQKPNLVQGWFDRKDFTFLSKSRKQQIFDNIKSW